MNRDVRDICERFLYILSRYTSSWSINVSPPYMYLAVESDDPDTDIHIDDALLGMNIVEYHRCHRYISIVVEHPLIDSIAECIMENDRFSIPIV